MMYKRRVMYTLYGARVRLLFLILLIALPLQAVAMGSKPEDSAGKTVDIAKEAEAGIYNFRVISASYGLNCQSKPKVGVLGIPSPDQKYKSIKADNAVEIIKTLCENKPLCSFNVSPEVLKLDPAPKCSKELEVTYRCYNIDSPHILKVKDGDKFEIKCTAPDAAKPEEK